jgi:hypothetical protein
VADPQRVGVILVHGIGEQRRFEHLDGQTRFLIEALQGLRGTGQVESVSVDIVPSEGAAFQAEQDSWVAGQRASVEIDVRHRLFSTPQEARIFVHEVWWADINEPYSIAKQIRFWFWGLAVWAHPGKQRSTRPTVGQVEPLAVRGLQSAWARAQLYMVAVFFVLLGYSIGTITVVLTRLFQLDPPRLLVVLTNYVSSVKLYNQHQRYGTSPFGGKEDFLDTVGEPPRVSIRRRMIRAIADVACNKYDRWYVLAHSQGSVVAYNGLMETAYAWPGYLDKERWTRLRKCFVKQTSAEELANIRTQMSLGNFTMPRRPGWVAESEEVSRPAIFSRFRGMLTYGSPLAKFAFIWPSLVPMSTQPAFAADARWLNLYDPIDPVSGLLRDFAQQADTLNAGHWPLSCCPPPVDLGYNAGSILLLAHLGYLTQRRGCDDAATATVEWLLTDSTASFGPPVGNASNLPAISSWLPGNWFQPGGMRTFRRIVAYTTWFAAAALLLLLGAVVLPTILQIGREAAISFWTTLEQYAR